MSTTHYNWTSQQAHGDVELHIGVLARDLEQATPFVGLTRHGERS
jgi:hypothetical protein